MRCAHGSIAKLLVEWDPGPTYHVQRLWDPGGPTYRLKWVKFMAINLRNYVLDVFQVTSWTMRCAHGSIAKILVEWDPGPTYHVQRLWDPGGPTYSSR